MNPLTVAVGALAIAGIGAAWWCWRRARRAEATAATLKQQLRAARHAARHDPLTGLPNRRAFWQMGTALLADPAHLPVVAVLIDIDDFKRINDTFGHAVGDQVLVTLARRLAMYGAGNMVARLGGDEFAALLAAKGTSSRSACPDMGELGRMLATPMCIAGHYVQVTASVGLATVHAPADLTQVMNDADAAMYRAKTLGRSTTYTYPILDHSAHQPVKAIPGRPENGTNHAGRHPPKFEHLPPPVAATRTSARHPASTLTPPQPEGNGHARP